jgi:ATP-dependent DNA helicase RecG
VDIVELRERIARWEDLHTEFKQRIDNTDDLAASLVAFANTDGGQLVIGVANDRSITGIADADREHQRVDGVAFNNCEPPLTVLQESLDVDAKKVVVVNIPKGAQRPYRTNRGRYYIRTTSGRHDASREELLRLFQATESLYYDETPLPRLTLADLDLEAFERYLNRTGQGDLTDDPPRILRNWSLLVDAHPTVAGVLLFGRDPQRHLPFAQINAARFAGKDSADEPVDRKDITGRLIEVIEDAQRFLRIALEQPHQIRAFEPELRPELPEEALREAVVNAVAHRDYTVQGPVRLFVFEDRVEIHTPGRPPNTVNEIAMRSGVHVVRNPRIYTRLSDAGLVTGAGSGIRRIIKLVKEATGKDTGIEIRDFEVLIVMPRHSTNDDATRRTLAT